ncbi:asparagine synthase (glutamine-hydrolyzing) [Flavobacterium jejuense]|uniref:asparagine synthase (glutamine-hydrolyzing) n=1 Tax=Flavobacterium jejuense TaxID=1544455 RepID=A0ABX0IRF7_9FLAO|nr:asparagine synthase (glutamine-hydrolyzing) [Flavobacterium jejuense]NHN26151.1 asparagine synthase (glutamine-hydrolyzing) [Flavobacterium jejuense]
MCGITGFIATRTLDHKKILENMIFKMNHRGPDSNGTWFNENLNIGLGHARLSIVDLSETGHQPMLSNSGRYHLVFNGEIYNHLDIRKQLDKYLKINWRGTSDTETILTAIENWGIEKTIENCIGMFAIALFDAKNETLTLIRDRMGEKPLYYGWVNDNFVFASELNPIKTFPLFNNPINRNALVLYMKHASIPEPYSIYENIYKLESGCFLTMDIKDKTITKKQYWSTQNKANQNNNPIFKDTPENAVKQLEQLLINAVGIQMNADVPLGAFLSGGVDSSTIVALMHLQSDSKVNTFSIGFDQKEYNEAEHAKKVANHIGTDHHEAYISAKEVLDIVPEIPKIYTEPFSESSQIPTYLVSKIAKQKVTVSLSGDAGDELFCGYSRYQLANKSWNKISRIPHFVRVGVGNSIQMMPYGFLQTILLPLKGKKNDKGIQINVVDKLLKASELLKFKDRKEFYHKGFMTHNLQATNWVLHSEKTKTLFESNSLVIDNYFAEMMATDLITYLPNNNLAKVDRAAMANSLETRVPLLDHRVVDFALSLPMEYKLRNGVDKWVLREVLYKYVPKSLIERPKMGFGVPLASWLRGPLKEWCENLINPKRLNEEGFFNTTIVREKWQEHLSGKRNWENQLWDVIVFQSWLDQQKNN